MDILLQATFFGFNCNNRNNKMVRILSTQLRRNIMLMFCGSNISQGFNNMKKKRKLDKHHRLTLKKEIQNKYDYKETFPLFFPSKYVHTNNV